MSPDESTSAVDRAVDRRMALAREWDDLVAEARRLPGFADFLRTPRTSSLLPAAKGGPVVYVNVSRWRCDALIVTVDGVERVELPGLTAAAVAERVRTHLLARQEFEVAAAHAQRGATRSAVAGLDSPNRSDAEARGSDGPPAEAIDGQLGPAGSEPAPPTSAVSAARASAEVRRARQALDADLRGLTAWLWDVLAERVLGRLGYLDGPSPATKPRLWWCPTGLLTLLPLHAAGYHDEVAGIETVRQTVQDLVVSSYTPTLRALLRASASGLDAGSPSWPGADPRMLIVSLPSTPGQPNLSFADAERDIVRRRFPGEQHTLLEGDSATRSAVEAALPGHRWAHFSCHGDQRLGDPSSGGLVLRDQMLRIADIGAARTAREFVFLSACKTATGGVNLPDETISLAAALHYTGYRHVVASLWSVYDSMAAEVSASVYGDLMSTGRFEPARSAAALDAAIANLRRLYPRNLSVWTPFTHTGA